MYINSDLLIVRLSVWKCVPFKLDDMGRREEVLDAMALNNSLKHLENPNYRICNFTSPHVPRKPSTSCVHQRAEVIHLNALVVAGTAKG